MSDEVTALEQEADATRDRIAATMDDLQHRLSPRTLLNNVVGQVGNKVGAQGVELVLGARQLVRNHPIATASAALTVGLMMFGRARIRGAKIDYGDNFSAYPEYDDGYGANSVDDRWVADQPRRPAFGSNTSSRVEENPLAAVLVGVAAGALLGALFPLTGTERRLFDEFGERISDAGDAFKSAATDSLGLAAE